MIIYGIKETMKLLLEGAIKRLIIFDNLDYNHVELKPINNKDGNDIVIRYLTSAEIEYKTTWVEKETGIEYAILSSDLLIDWLGDNYQEYQVELFFVTDRSPEGNQFVKGFAGIGGLLKYKVDMEDHFGYGDESDSDSDLEFI